jgi:uncharacterized membrane protein
MTIRLQEMHPAIVHVPIAFLPLSVGADLLGRTTNEPLLSFGRKAMVVAAAGAAAAGLSGLIAGEEVNVEGESRDMLMTHRNLNFLGAIVLGCMALWRVRHDRPSATYLGIGAAATGLLGYTAYLGGKLISDFGVGVRPAGGIYRPDAPALGAAPATAVLKDAATDLVHGVEHMVEEVGHGQLVPALVGGSRKRPTSTRAGRAPGGGTAKRARRSNRGQARHMTGAAQSARDEGA